MRHDPGEVVVAEVEMPKRIRHTGEHVLRKLPCQLVVREVDGFDVGQVEDRGRQFAGDVSSGELYGFDGGVVVAGDAMPIAWIVGRGGLVPV